MSLATIQERIDTCIRIRKWTAYLFSEILNKRIDISEKQFARCINAQIKDNHELHPEGWYAPPPFGIAALFSEPNNFNRLKFDTLRKEKFWPQAHNYLTNNSVGMIYASPIHRSSGMIGDFGMTIYRGNDPKVQAHMAKSLNVIEQAAEYAQVGMEFRELHYLTQSLFEKIALHNARTITLTDRVGTNLGHTFPWSYEEPTSEERKIIKSDNLNDLRDLISQKRINVNRLERFKIPSNIAFTLEARLESFEEPKMPNTLFHVVITFQNGTKKIVSNLNNVFSALSMDSYIKSKF